MDEGRLAELTSIATSDAPTDIAARPAAIVELAAEIQRCWLLAASQQAHIDVIGAQLGALTTPAT